MFIRFVLLKSDPESTKKQGILVAAHELRDEGDLTIEEHQILREALSWFNQHLKVPACLKRSENRRALSWFKDSAQKPLQHMWNLVYILRDHGLHVDVIKTDDPGTIIYEDGWQIVAKPRRGQAKHSW